MTEQLARKPRRGFNYCECGTEKDRYAELCRKCRDAARTPTPERIMARVVEDPATGCWIWTGAKNAGGYGHFYKHGTYYRVNRYLWEHKHGPIPATHELHHTCMNPSCCRLDHHELLLRREHKRRHSYSTERANAASRVTLATRSHCRHGHEYTDENTIRTPTGRDCKECRRIVWAKTRARIKGERRQEVDMQLALPGEHFTVRLHCDHDVQIPKTHPRTKNGWLTAVQCPVCRGRRQQIRIILKTQDAA